MVLLFLANLLALPFQSVLYVELKYAELTCRNDQFDTCYDTNTLCINGLVLPETYTHGDDITYDTIRDSKRGNWVQFRLRILIVKTMGRRVDNCVLY